MNKSSRILLTSYGKQGVVELPYFLCTNLDVNISNFNVLCNIFLMDHEVFYFYENKKLTTSLYEFLDILVLSYAHSL